MGALTCQSRVNKHQGDFKDKPRAGAARR